MRWANLVLLVVVSGCQVETSKTRDRCGGSQACESFDMGQIAIRPFHNGGPELRGLEDEMLVNYGTILLARARLCSLSEQELLGLEGERFTLPPDLFCGAALANDSSVFKITHCGLMSDCDDGEPERLVVVPDMPREEEEPLCKEAADVLQQTPSDEERVVSERGIALYLASKPLQGERRIKLVFRTRIAPGEPRKLVARCVSASVVRLGAGESEPLEVG